MNTYDVYAVIHTSIEYLYLPYYIYTYLYYILYLNTYVIFIFGKPHKKLKF